MSYRLPFTLAVLKLFWSGASKSFTFPSVTLMYSSRVFVSKLQYSPTQNSALYPSPRSFCQAKRIKPIWNMLYRVKSKTVRPCFFAKPFSPFNKLVLRLRVIHIKIAPHQKIIISLLKRQHSLKFLPSKSHTASLFGSSAL